jgi:hypothetical protein
MEDVAARIDQELERDMTSEGTECLTYLLLKGKAWSLYSIVRDSHEHGMNFKADVFESRLLTIFLRIGRSKDPPFHGKQQSCMALS